MLNNILRIIFVIMLTGFSNFNAAAKQNPNEIKYVFRLDGRSPPDVYKSGMSSWGNNTNLYSHIEGDSCTEAEGTDKNSAFISVSSRPGWAERRLMIWMNQFNPTSDPFLESRYVYIIRATSNFYSAEISLRHYINTSPSAEVNTYNYSNIRDAREYLTLNRILPENIVGYYAYEPYEDGQLEIVRHNNPNYNENNFDPNDIASTEPLTITQSGENINDRRLSWVTDLPFAGACLNSESSQLKVNNGKQVLWEKDYPVSIILQPGS